ncbi:MAG: hypothetical protein HZB16_17325 [Armatimonadetes bacterium]|nr:hypothetical protein [Armatimonadota bacterium]
MPPEPTGQRIVSLRVVVLALLLTPPVAWWIFCAEIVYPSVHATVLSIFWTAVDVLVAALAANAVLRRLWPKLALNRGELLVLYSMVAMGTSLASHDLTQILLPLMVVPYRFATPENRWQELFHGQLPKRLLVQDSMAVKGFFEGHARFWDPDILGLWVGPLCCWALLVGLVLAWMLGMSLLLRRAWCDEERLSFPCIHLPLQMTSPETGLWRSPYLWAGFAVAGTICLLRAGHALHPAIPELPTKWDLRTYITERPWSAIGWTPLCIYPFAIGLAWFMPQDLAFSTWFFYLFWKGQMVLREWLGWGSLAGPYASDQSAGAWVAVGLFALGASRRPIAQALRRAWRSDERDAAEPVAGRSALLLFAAGLVGMTCFIHAVGLDWWPAAGFVLVYGVLAVAVTRMRAELGPPTHDLYFAGPDWALTAGFGPAALGVRNLTALSMLFWLTRDYRSLPMPHQLEAFRLHDWHRTRRRDGNRLAAALLLVGVVGFLAASAAALTQYYEQGGLSGIRGYGTGLARESFSRLESWMTTAKPGPDHAALTQFGGGGLLTLGMMALRRRFLAVPFHPVGYAIAGSWTMSWLWFSVFLSWVIKGFVLRHGGLRRFRAAMPFFLGLMLGDYVVGGGVTLLSLWLHRPVPGFFT